MCICVLACVGIMLCHLLAVRRFSHNYFRASNVLPTRALQYHTISSRAAQWYRYIRKVERIQCIRLSINMNIKFECKNGLLKRKALEFFTSSDFRYGKFIAKTRSEPFLATELNK